MAKPFQRFLLIELLDQDVCSLIEGLRSAFGQKKSSDVHITVRGPKNTIFSEKNVLRFQNKLEHEPILIQSAGIFENNSTYVVYLKAESLYLQKIWYKPDYKNKIIPHISVYIGKDKQLAYSIRDFIKKEGIEILCFNYRLITYTAKQTSFLFKEKLQRVQVENNFKKLIEVGRIKKDILDRAIGVLEKKMLHLSAN